MVKNKNEIVFRKLVKNIIKEFSSSESTLVNQQPEKQDIISRTVGKFVLPSTLSLVKTNYNDLISKIDENTNRKEILDLLSVLALETIIHYGNTESIFSEGLVKENLKYIIQSTTALKDPKKNISHIKSLISKIKISPVTTILSKNSQTVEIENAAEKNSQIVIGEPESKGDDSFLLSDPTLTKITESAKTKKK
jgi:hypothetical protein